MGLLAELKKTIFKSKKSKMISLGILGAIILLAAYAIISAQNANIKEVTMAEVTKGDLTQYVTITGNIEAKSRNEISLSPATKVVAVYVKEGQAVKKGDLLAKLDDRDYQNQLIKQRINLSNANSTLSYVLNSSNVMDKAATVGALNQAEITLENAQTSYNDVYKKYEQSRILYEHGYISATEFDAARKGLSDVENAVSSANIALNNAKMTFSNIDATVGERAASQRTQISLIKADIDYLNQKIADCNLKANVDGKVTKMDAVANQYPDSGDMIIVDETSTFVLDLDVSQYDSVNIKTGQKAVIKVKGLDKEYEGKVTAIGLLSEKSLTSADQDSKVNVKVEITNPDESIKVGYEADADIILAQKKSVLQVSFEAVQDEKSTGKKYVFVVGGGGIAEKRYITTGLDTDYYIEVLSGLKEGEKCIANPDKDIADGVKVKEAKGSQ
ncbi:MAG: efflux RND transporter periplasmic adaptor subunit [Clostridiaceae bacterium]